LTYQQIPLTQGQIALVDAEDYDFLMQWKWCALWNQYTQSFYAVRNSEPVGDGYRHPIPMQREILGLSYGDPRRADHIENGQTLDNRRSNLRICTPSQNAANGRMHRDNRSGYKGVSWGTKDKKWVVQVSKRGKRVYRKGFRSPVDAAQVYALVAYLHFGEFARIAMVNPSGKLA
jgi:hypothetical protein